MILLHSVVMLIKNCCHLLFHDQTEESGLARQCERWLAAKDGTKPKTHRSTDTLGQLTSNRHRG
jgi:hypothetical protein